MDEAQELAGEVGIMSGGHLLACGSIGELVDQAGLKRHRLVVERPNLEEVYLAIVGRGRADEARPA